MIFRTQFRGIVAFCKHKGPVGGSSYTKPSVFLYSIFPECRLHSVSRTVKTPKFTSLYFRNETCFGAGNLYKDLLWKVWTQESFFSIYLQPSVKKNSYNLAFWLCNLMTSRWKPSIGKKPFLTIKMSVFQGPNNGTFLVRLTHDFGKKKTSIFFSFFYFS